MKNKIRFLIVLALVIAVFSVCYFVIPYKHNNETVFILGYIFTLVAMLAQIYTFYVGLSKSKDLKSKFYGFPIIKVGAIYLLVQFVLTVLITIINAFVDVPGWISVIVNVIVLAFSVIGLITVETYKEEIEKVESVEKVDTLFLDDLKTNAKSLYNKFDYAPLKGEMKKLYELIQYSDPVSSPELASVEDEITRKFNSLKATCSEKAYDRVQSEINDLVTLMEERNFRCKKLK